MKLNPKVLILEFNGEEVSKVESSSVSLLLTLTWVTGKVNTTNKGLNLKNILHSEVGNFMQSLSSFLNIFSGDMFFHVLIIGLFYVFLFFGQNLGEM